MQFADIIGQRELINKLIDIIDSKRVSHAQLFLGLNGYGSLPLSIAYAQYLNCGNKQHFSITDPSRELKADSCGVCPNCVKYNRLEHPDLHFIFPNTTTSSVKSNPSSADFQKEFRGFLQETNGYATLFQWFENLGIETKQGTINVRDANEIVKILSYKSYEAPYKVVIIWMVEKLYYSAAPKLLKILEEPEENTLFLLVAEEQEKILSTILSRVQQVKLPRISENDLKAALAKTTDASEPMLQKAAQSSEGNYIKALDFLKRDHENQLFVNGFVTWMRMVYSLHVSELSKWIDSISTWGREQQKAFLQHCLNTFRACFLTGFGVTSSSYMLEFGDEKFSQTFPKFINGANIEEIENNINEAIYSIERNAYSKIVWMDLSLKINQLLKRKK